MHRRAAQAQQLGWTNVGGPPGGLLPVLHTTQSGALLAVDEIGRVGHSADHGETWTVVDLADVNGFSNAGGETLAATDAGVYRSTDDGTTWALLAAGPEPLHSVARADDTTLVATGKSSGRDDPQYVTRDGGATWNAIGVGGSRVFRAQNGRVYTAGVGQRPNFTRQSRLLEWNVASARWDTLGGPGTDGRFTAQVRAIDALADGTIVVASGESGILWCSVGGLHVRAPDGTWATYNEQTEVKCYGPQAPDVQATALHVAPGEVLVGRYGQVDRYVPTGGGAYRFDRLYDAPGDAAVRSLAATSSRILVSSVSECVVLIDGPGDCTVPGVARIDRSSGQTGEVGFGMQTVHVLSSSYASDPLALTDLGLWNLEMPCVEPRCRPEWTLAAAPSPEHPDLVTHIERTPWGWGLEGDEFLVEIDDLFGSGGAIWEQGEWRYLNDELGNASFVASGDGLIIATSEQGGTARSTDRGITFERVSEQGFFDSEPASFAFPILAGGSDGIYASADSGATWTIRVDTRAVGPVRSIEYGSESIRMGKAGASATPIPILGALAGHTVLRGLSSTVANPDEGWTLPDSVDLAGARLVGALNMCVVTREEVWCIDEGTTEMKRVYQSPGGMSQRLSAAGIRSLGFDGYRIFVATAYGLLMLNEPIFVGESESSTLPSAELTVHPNPAAGRVFVTLPTGTIQAEVFDLTGRRVATLGVASATAEWDTSPHAPGLYLVRAVTPSGVVSRAVVVAR